jgi:hypothetical protein
MRKESATKDRNSTATTIPNQRRLIFSGVSLNGRTNIQKGDRDTGKCGMSQRAFS